MFNTTFLTVFLSVLFSYGCGLSAQPKLGVSAGITNSRIIGGNQNSSLRIHNPYGKISGQFAFRKKWTAEVSMAYMALGGRLDEESRPNRLSSHQIFHLEYIHWESNLAFHPWKKLYLQIGAYAGFLARHQAQSIMEISQGISQVQTIQPNVRDWDMGYQGGIGFTSNNGVQVGLQLFIGATPVLKIYDFDYSISYSTLSFTYWIPLKNNNAS